MAVRGGVGGDGSASAARSVPFGTTKIRQTLWIVCAQGSEASARWLGEVLWVSPGRIPALRHPGQLLLGLPARFPSIAPSWACRAARGRWSLYADLLLFCVVSARQAAHQCSWWCRYVQWKLWFAPGGHLRREISPFRYAHVGALRCEIATHWALYAALLLFFVISARQAAHQCSWWCICVQQKLWFASCGRLRREIASFGFAHALHHGLGHSAVKWPSFEANSRCVSRGGLKLSLVGRARALRPFLACRCRGSTRTWPLEVALAHCEPDVYWHFAAVCKLWARAMGLCRCFLLLVTNVGVYVCPTASLRRLAMH